MEVFQSRLKTQCQRTCLSTVLILPTTFRASNRSCNRIQSNLRDEYKCTTCCQTCLTCASEGGDLQLALEAGGDDGGPLAVAPRQVPMQCVEQPSEELHRVALLVDAVALATSRHHRLHELVRANLHSPGRRPHLVLCLPSSVLFDNIKLVTIECCNLHQYAVAVILLSPLCCAAQV